MSQTLVREQSSGNASQCPWLSFVGKRGICLCSSCARNSCRIEQRISNSSLTSCARFHRLAHRCRRQVSREIGFAPRCTELRSFAAKNSPTVEATVKSEFPRARVWSCSTLVLRDSANKTKSCGRQALRSYLCIDLDIERVCREPRPSLFLSFSSFMKTALLKSNLLIKPSIVLAAAVLTAASFLAPSTASCGRSPT